MPESQIELRNEGVQEIMGRIPPWTVRYGIMAMAMVLVLIIGLAGLIRWPDVVTAQGVLTNTDPPRNVVARVDGRLVRTLVQEGMSVKAGTTLAVIESAADPVALDSLRSLLPRIVGFLNGTTDSLPTMTDLDLGEGRVPWSELRTAATELAVWRGDRFRTERNVTLEQKIGHYQQMVRATETQIAWAKRKQRNQLAEAAIDTSLVNKGVIATSEFRKNQNAFMDQQMGLSALEAGLYQQRITLIDLRNQISDITHTDAAKERELNERCSSSLNALVTFLNGWQLDHELRAPVDGRVHFPVRLAAQQMIKSGEALFRIAPGDSTYVVEANLPSMGSGKVKVGQTVYVELDGFPRAEYGRLIGKVSSLGSTPGEKGYSVLVELPDGLVTSFHRTLDFKPEMAVKVDVVTHDRSALGRVFATLRGAVDR